MTSVWKRTPAAGYPAAGFFFLLFSEGRSAIWSWGKSPTCRRCGNEDTISGRKARATGWSDPAASRATVTLSALIARVEERLQDVRVVDHLLPQVALRFNVR